VRFSIREYVGFSTKRRKKNWKQDEGEERRRGTYNVGALL
jgi:hypothetical protein